MLRKITLAFVVLMIAGLVSAQGDGVGTPEDQCLVRGGTFNQDTGECQQLASLEIDIQYPIELANEAGVSPVLDDHLLALRTQFLNDFIEYGLSPFPAPWTLYVDYEVFNHSDDILSVQFSESWYTGGAHPNLLLSSFTFNTATGDLLSLGDFFSTDDYLITIADIARIQLQDTLGDMTDADWLESGTEPTEENYSNWVLTTDALVITFEPYQVAAYAAGPQTVTIPLADLTGWTG